jgi:hypothetical protein
MAVTPAAATAWSYHQLEAVFRIFQTAEQIVTIR